MPPSEARVVYSLGAKTTGLGQPKTSENSTAGQDSVCLMAINVRRMGDLERYQAFFIIVD